MFNYHYFFFTNIMITINNINNSTNLLFSIPVHEKQNVINNTIENIFNFNPNSKIILHINNKFTSFQKENSNYHNLFFNYTNINYSPGEDLLAYHVSNFNYCINKNIEFKYFIFCASNELYIKKGAIHYINQYKNGLQIVKYNEDIDWHNFKKNLHENEFLLKLFDSINNNTLCGGQTEGQFFEKSLFKKISEIYLKVTKNNTFHIDFEAEEIFPATILNSLNINHGNPLNLQNYTNNINFSIDYIKNIIKGITIPENTIKNQLFSPHINENSNNVYSIKRVDRTFNSIRNFLTNKGFILNNNDYMLNTFYYSNTSSLFINNNYDIQFKKTNIGLKDFQWFGFSIQKGSYNIEFEIKSNQFINNHYNCGLKLHHPFNYTISHFLNNINSDEYKKISIPIINKYEQDIIFIFDDYSNKINIDIKNININKNQISKNNKKNIFIVLFKNNNNSLHNLNNINYNLISIFKKIYNVYIIAIISNNNNIEKSIFENINPHFIFYSNNIHFNNILQFTHQSINKLNINYDFIFISNIDILYLQTISNLNIIINKINFLSYKNNNNNIELNYDLSIIPFEYFDKLIHVKNNILDFLHENHIQYHLLLNDFYYKNEYLILNNIKTTFINNGFLFENNFIQNIDYYNNHCFFKKINNNHFYFFKNITNKYQEFLWCGYNLKFSEEKNSNITVKIKFNIKINNKFTLNDKTGLKTHYPLQFYNKFFKDIVINKFTSIEFNITILKKNQLIIFNFDNYFNEIEFEIKDFQLIYNIN